MEVNIPNIYPVACHTDNIGPGSTFVAIPGTKFNGIDFIEKAIVLGASKIVIPTGTIVNFKIQKLIDQNNIELTFTDNPRRELAILSAKALNYPAKSLKILGITGTKGKTTTSYILENILKSAGYKTALMGTVKKKILDTSFKANLTTEQPDFLNVFFNVCVENKVDYAIMEVAAQAYSLERIYSIEFDGLIFTNFSLEHTEFYGSIEEYFNAKAAILNQCKEDKPIILNLDDSKVSSLKSKFKNSLGFSLKNQADFQAKIKQINPITLDFLNQQEIFEVKADNLIGEFNCYNIVSAISLAKSLNIKTENILDSFKTFEGVPGRLQKFDLKNGALAVIDYAHNAASMEAILSTLKELKPFVVSVFGAGGDRSKEKRPEMGQVASKYSDIIILTTDNPRSEEPEAIIRDILKGIDKSNLNKIFIELDREKAINLAYSLSDKDSVIALLGKGPDEYQHVKDIKTPFSEANILSTLV